MQHLTEIIERGFDNSGRMDDAAVRGGRDMSRP